MMNMMWTVETGDTGFNNTIHLVELAYNKLDYAYCIKTIMHGKI